MPTEHEFKVVLSLELAKDISPVDLREASREHQHIQQGYLAFSKGMTTRIRSVDNGKKKRWFLTFKQKIGDRVVEVEKKLDKRDGHDLWSVCVGKLKKDRYVIDNDGITWELDLFRKGNHLYFVMAEVEMPEGSPRPSRVPELFRDYVVYEVPLTDDRFSNKRLGDVEYATNLYTEITEGESDGN